MFSNNVDVVTLQAAITRLLRWASRPSVAGELAGPEAADLSPTDLWLLDGVVRHGPARMGQVLDFPIPGGEAMKARIVDPVFYDKEGSRQNG